MQLCLMRMRAALIVHDQTMRNNDPSWDARASQVWSITLKMLGKQANPCMTSKANETRQLLEFAGGLFEAHAEKLGQHDELRY